MWLRHECGEDRVEVARARAAALARGRRLHLGKEQLLAAKRRKNRQPRRGCGAPPKSAAALPRPRTPLGGSAAASATPHATTPSSAPPRRCEFPGQGGSARGVREALLAPLEPKFYFRLFAERGSAGGERSDPAALPRGAPFPFARGREGAPAGAGGVRGGSAPPAAGGCH